MLSYATVLSLPHDLVSQCSLHPRLFIFAPQTTIDLLKAAMTRAGPKTTVLIEGFPRSLDNLEAFEQQAGRCCEDGSSGMVVRGVRGCSFLCSIRTPLFEATPSTQVLGPFS